MAGEGYDAGRFDEVSTQLVKNVSDNREITTHGTPAQRAAAVDRGLDVGRPAACHLVGFH